MRGVRPSLSRSCSPNGTRTDDAKPRAQQALLCLRLFPVILLTSIMVTPRNVFPRHLPDRRLYNQTFLLTFLWVNEMVCFSVCRRCVSGNVFVGETLRMCTISLVTDHLCTLLGLFQRLSKRHERSHHQRSLLREGCKAVLSSGWLHVQARGN